MNISCFHTMEPLMLWCWLVRVSLFINSWCPWNWRQNLGTFMIGRHIKQGSAWWKFSMWISDVTSLQCGLHARRHFCQFHPVWEKLYSWNSVVKRKCSWNVRNVTYHTQRYAHRQWRSFHSQLLSLRKLRCSSLVWILLCIGRLYTEHYGNTWIAKY